jgi:hypothetical protein
MRTSRLWLTCGLCIIVAPMLAAANDDQIGARLEVAQKRYDDALAAVAKDVQRHLDRRKEVASKAEDLPLVNEIEAAREAFEKSGEIPDDAPPIFFRRANAADAAFASACETAVAAYTRAGRTEDAARIEKRLEEIRELSVKRRTRFSGEVRITAKSEIGYEVGKLNKNDRIRLSYQGGSWKHFGNVASNSPDSEKLDRNSGSRLVICEADDHDRTRVLAIVPPRTRYQSFEWVANRNFERIVLRINDSDGDFASNPDKNVQYSLEVLRGF